MPKDKTLRRKPSLQPAITFDNTKIKSPPSKQLQQLCVLSTDEIVPTRSLRQKRQTKSQKTPAKSPQRPPHKSPRKPTPCFIRDHKQPGSDYGSVDIPAMSSSFNTTSFNSSGYEANTSWSTRESLSYGSRPSFSSSLLHTSSPSPDPFRVVIQPCETLMDTRIREAKIRIIETVPVLDPSFVKGKEHAYGAYIYPPMPLSEAEYRGASYNIGVSCANGVYGTHAIISINWVHPPFDITTVASGVEPMLPLERQKSRYLRLLEEMAFVLEQAINLRGEMDDEDKKNLTQGEEIVAMRMTSSDGDTTGMTKYPILGGSYVVTTL
ncbi:hypothetical protein EJ05DRAFT_21269 [Pseudovirgaria hyperparasitica]|uniref:Uncharacterized protein n=1 Tax=Pseudovirgaria hyperparasitica TaxID=470096 RepID=A0A6A6WL84_9PEZI|nr:uncharacterized protein EJ05DRAFT_21269 [Pseudovirgaria hyperparasitica]KAF2762941.1 hypothetical protein EJ05DRAFT_21269 [Pseudovirgaria hyperparasitica]